MIGLSNKTGTVIAAVAAYATLLMWVGGVVVLSLSQFAA
jgi:hypothetical protein